MAVTVHTSIAERFRTVVESAPEAIALTAPRARYTYAELDRWSDAIAVRLLAQHGPLDQPVEILTRDPIALVPAALGVVKAGHCFVVLDASDPAPRLATIRAAANSSCIVEITDPAFSDTLHLPPTVPHELVQIVFTSGTTGAPKAVRHAQRGFAERCVIQSAMTGRAAGARVSYTALPGFARATFEIFGSLLNGATLCSFDARAETLDGLAEFIRREQVGVLTLTPALFRRFMKTVPDSLDLSCVKKLRIGADVVTVADVAAYKARFPRTCTLERSFNATETGIVMHMTIDHDTAIPGPLVPIGRPRPNVEVRVIDDEGNAVAEGEVGELIVRSPYVETADGVFATGDLVRRDAEGLYYFIGRKDSRLKIHGRRIDPLEVESALVSWCAVREAVAVGKPGTDGELRLVAYVVMTDGQPFVPRQIRAALRDKLPAAMIPSELFLLEAMPVTAGGKVDRAALTTRVEPEAVQDDDATDDLERALLEIWSRVLDRPVLVHDDFFEDLGGQSVVAAHLVTEVHRLLGSDMPLSLLLELNTVARMADYLRVRGGADLERTAILVQRGEETHPPLFCVSGKGGSVVVFRELAAHLGTGQTLYGLTHHGLAPDAHPRTFEGLAACYVDAMRAIQPQGPYFVAGFSAGGLVAFDMARQLAQAGEVVAFVGVIDTPATRQRVPSWKYYAKRVMLLREKPLVNARRLARSMAQRALGLVRTPPAPFRSINRIYDSLPKRDGLRPYTGRVTLFLARHGWGFDGTTPDLGWKALCGHLDIIHVDGEHHTVLGEDVASLAAAMRAAMQIARGE